MPPVGHYWRKRGRADLQRCRTLQPNRWLEKRGFMLIRWRMERGMVVGAVEMKGKMRWPSIQIALGPWAKLEKVRRFVDE